MKKVIGTVIVIFVSILLIAIVIMYHQSDKALHIPDDPKIDKIVVVQNMMPISPVDAKIEIQDQRKIKLILAEFNHAFVLPYQTGRVMDGNQRTFKFYSGDKLVKSIFLAENFVDNHDKTTINSRKLSVYTLGR